MATRSDIARYRRNWQGEVDATFTYRALAELETQPQLAEVYQRMADIEQKHAHFWEQKLRDAGVAVSAGKPTFRARATARIARKFGPQTILSTLSATETHASRGYDNQPEAVGTGMPADEHSHARVLRAIAHGTGADSATATGMEGGSLARLEGRHRAVGGNALRAAVLGANDGLCSMLSLLMGVAGGVAGATADPVGASRTVLLAGVAGTLAGACAMAMGEWLSVQSARELAERQIAIEADELKESPEEEREELALIYQAKGLPRDEAQSLATRLISNHDTALDTLAREELGLDPEELGGSAWEAAITSFLLFIAGAAAPVVPWIFLTGTTAILVSLACSAVALFGIGAIITLLTGRSVLYSGLRQLLFGFAAAGITYAIGHLIGVAVS